MGPAPLRAAASARTLALALCCCLGVSCGGDGGTSPEAPTADPTSLAGLFGSTLVRSDGSSVAIQALQTKALIGIYFAAGWCPACAAFTPRLVAAYDTLRAADASFEIVMVSFDYGAADMLAHMKSRGMRWPAVPYESGSRRALADLYGVQLIPTLVVIDAGLRTITRDGRDDVAVKGSAAYGDWLTASRGR
jgi:thiol-disulfide isomerase/thioredoxin